MLLRALGLAACLSGALAPPPRCTVTDGVVFVDECTPGFAEALDAAGQPDHTALIQTALNASGAHTVVLRNVSKAAPWISRPLFVYLNDSTVRFDGGAFLLAKRGRDCRRVRF